jgi:Tfp pilus assembly protein PilF|tara:strand:+ start:185 stop:394 length:210 start_codon:yes stop_codon:yes gene_type:complete
LIGRHLEIYHQHALHRLGHGRVALHLLGVIANQVGKHDTAIDLITRALAIKPDYAKTHNNLGNALCRSS